MINIVATAEQEVDNLLSNIFDNNFNNTNLHALIYKIGLLHDDAQKLFLAQKNPSLEDEIFYFKHIKSKLLAYIHLLNAINDIEQRKPTFKYLKFKKYYLSELGKVKKRIKENEKMYSYHKAEATEFDVQFFARQQHNIITALPNMVIEINKSNNTPYVPIYATVISYDCLKRYLKLKIKSYTQDTRAQGIANVPKIYWTDNKINLIELVYALHANGSFNDGLAEIKQIAEYFEKVFDVDLGQYNRIFIDIKSRKINTTKFIDTLKLSLKNKIQSSEY